MTTVKQDPLVGVTVRMLKSDWKRVRTSMKKRGYRELAPYIRLLIEADVRGQKPGAESAE